MAKLSLLFSFILLSAAATCLSGEAKPGQNTSVATATAATFVESSCSATTDPAHCVRTLKHTRHNNPWGLARAALVASRARAKSARALLAKLKKLKGLKKSEYRAIDDCVELMGLAIGGLGDSKHELRSLRHSKSERDFSWHMSNLNTWLSAASTDCETCVDGFYGNGLNDKVVKELVKAYVGDVDKITDISLLLITRLVYDH